MIDEPLRGGVEAIVRATNLINSPSRGKQVSTKSVAHEYVRRAVVLDIRRFPPSAVDRLSSSPRWGRLSKIEGDLEAGTS
jgi:hypothetical protein